MALDPNIMAMAMAILSNAQRGGGAAPAPLPKTPFPAAPKPAPAVPQNPFAGGPVQLNLQPSAVISKPGQITTYTPGQGDPKMEGGFETATGAPVRTLQDYNPNDPSSYVTLASRPDSPLFGKDITLTLGDGETIRGKVTDTGPGVKMLDVASSDPSHAKTAPAIFDRVGVTPNWVMDAVKQYNQPQVQTPSPPSFAPFAPGTYPIPGYSVPAPSATSYPVPGNNALDAAAGDWAQNAASSQGGGGGLCGGGGGGQQQGGGLCG